MRAILELVNFITACESVGGNELCLFVSVKSIICLMYKGTKQMYVFD